MQSLKDWCGMIHVPGVGQDSGSSMLDKMHQLAHFFFFVKTSINTSTIVKPIDNNSAQQLFWILFWQDILYSGDVLSR